MADLTVLIAPQPLPRTTTFSRFTRRAPSPVSRPIMVTLQLAADEPSSSSSTGSSSLPSSPTQKTSALPDSSLLSPPRNTFKARPRPHLPRSHTHPGPPAEIPVRPASAPPTETEFRRVPDFTPQTELEIYRNIKRRTGSLSTFAASNTHNGELVRPAPPLCKHSLHPSQSHHLRYSPFPCDLLWPHNLNLLMLTYAPSPPHDLLATHPPLRRHRRLIFALLAPRAP